MKRYRGAVLLVAGLYAAACVQGGSKRELRELSETRQEDNTDYFKLARETKDAFQLYSEERANESIDNETTTKLDQVARNYESASDEQVAESMEDTYNESKSSITAKQGAGVALIVVGAGMGATGTGMTVLQYRTAQSAIEANKKESEEVNKKIGEIEKIAEEKKVKLRGTFYNILKKIEKVTVIDKKSRTKQVVFILKNDMGEAGEADVKKFFKDSYGIDIALDGSPKNLVFLNGDSRLVIRGLLYNKNLALAVTVQENDNKMVSKKFDSKPHLEITNDMNRALNDIKIPAEISPSKFPKRFVAMGVAGLGAAVLGTLMVAEVGPLKLAESPTCQESPAVCRLIERLNKIAP
ncbi:MAG: hypothetical protein H6618_04345 [Deltaproteobacteria bacterium]|nr:hypothetical protein [Deltaproteobacteria bacterium]